MRPILYISPLPPPYGGIATWTQKILQYGLPISHPFIIIDSKIKGKRHIFDAARFSLSEIWRNVVITLRFCCYLVFKRPRLVHLNSSLSAHGIFRDLTYVCLAKVFMLPVVVHYHGNVIDFKYRHCYGLSGKALKMLLRFANMNIVINQTSLQALSTIKQSKVTYLPNFIEDAMFSNKISKQLNQSCRALFVGGITSTKGTLELIEIAKMFPQIEFHLFGKKHADMQSVTTPANIHLQGEIAHEILIERMPHYHFLIFPSHSEGFPLTVLEAMSSALPVIASSVGALPQMIDEGFGGFLCAPKDIQALCQAIRQLLAEPTLLVSMGEYNRQKSFQHYRYSKVIKDLMAIYHHVDSKCAA